MVGSPEVKEGPSEGLGAVGMLLAAAVVAAWWWVPRSAPPIELPALSLPRAEAMADLARDAALAEDAEEHGEERRTLYVAQGLAEVMRHDDPVRMQNRIDALRHVLDGWDQPAIDAVRAADLLRMEAALRGEGTTEERAGELGRFAETLTRWRATSEGQRVAPALVVRALAHARWNAVFDRTLTEGMSPIRERAYHGWLALHGLEGWSEPREAAVQAYEDAGGPRVRETRGILLCLHEEPVAAREELEASYAATSDLRVRNHAIACSLAH